MTCLSRLAGALVVKGAPEVLLGKCSMVAVGGEGGEAVRLTASRRRAAAVSRLAGRGLRVLAIAETALDGAVGAADAEDVAGMAHDLTLAGLVAIADVMQPDAADVVNQLAAARVWPVMITEDHRRQPARLPPARGYRTRIRF